MLVGFAFRSDAVVEEATVYSQAHHERCAAYDGGCVAAGLCRRELCNLRLQILVALAETLIRFRTWRFRSRRRRRGGESNTTQMVGEGAFGRE